MVKTKIDYQIDATFITQNETQDCIEKALQIIKCRNEDFLLHYGMTNNCTEEVNAMVNVFPGIILFY